MTTGEEDPAGPIPAPLLPAETCPYPEAQALLGWWRALPRAGRWPGWRAIDKIGLKPWMGRLVVYEAVDGGADYRYRLVGSSLAAHAGFDLTGRLVSEVVYAGSSAALLAHFARLNARGGPAWIDRLMPTARGYSMLGPRLWLPFGNGSGIGFWMVYVCDDQILVDPYDRP
jgi:hypothetical protein